MKRNSTKMIFSSAVLIFGVAGLSTLQANNSYGSQRVTPANAKTANLTPDQQSQGTGYDVELTRMARERLNKEDSLSTNAKNIKIITINHVMTLRGVVNSMSEKNRVAELAKNAAPKASVVNELRVETRTK